MKNIKEIAIICCLDWELVYRAVQKLNIIPVIQIGKRKFYDQYQQELIFDNLFYCGKLQYLIYESKLNNPTPEYSRKDFIEKGLIIENNS